MKSILRRIIAAIFWILLGRKNLVRFARFLSNEARFDVNNNMTTNGEMLVQDVLVKHITRTEPIVVFDCGANMGEWTLNFVERCLAKQLNDIQVHAFEPCHATYTKLLENLNSGRAKDFVITSRKALSNLDTTSLMYVVHDGAGTNSLFCSEEQKTQRTEQVEVITLNKYCEDMGIDHITFLKIDTEGNDMNVIEGGMKLFTEGKISLVQFEYNFRWIYARRFLRDAFEFFAPLGYHVGKITPKGIEFYTGWHPELESYREGNYLACRSEWMPRFPVIKWWQEDKE